MQTYLKMPYAGYRSSSNVEGQGVYGRYWSVSPNISDASRAYGCGYDPYRISPQGNYGRNTGYSIRCFKDFSVIPDSSWTVLYQ